MRVLKTVLWIGLALVVLTSCFLAGVLVGCYYGEFNNIPFVASGEWAIGIYIGPNPFQLSPALGVSQPVLTPADVTDMPTLHLADPFMVRENGIWYLFFEAVHAHTGQGNIGYATSADGLHWDYQRIIVDEPFHLSYPGVFKWNGGYYMIPESGEANAVLLYKATAFPNQWVREAKLIDKGWADPTFFVYRDTCWMYLTSPNRSILRLYYAADLYGPWVEHPMSPVIDGDKNTAGLAGRVTKYNGKLYRYAMDCDPDYGNAVRVFEINELSGTAYRETELPSSPILSGTGKGWNAERMHQVDPHQLDDSTWTACVDGRKEVLHIGLKY